MVVDDRARLDAIAERLDATTDLSEYGLCGRDGSTYYRLFAVPASALRRRSRATGDEWSVLTFATPNGDAVRATRRRFDDALMGQLCEVIVGVHEDPRERGRVHRHAIVVQPAGPLAVALAPLAAGD